MVYTTWYSDRYEGCNSSYSMASIHATGGLVKKSEVTPGGKVNFNISSGIGCSPSSDRCGTICFDGSSSTYCVSLNKNGNVTLPKGDYVVYVKIRTTYCTNCFGGTWSGWSTAFEGYVNCSGGLTIINNECGTSCGYKDWRNNCQSAVEVYIESYRRYGFQGVSDGIDNVLQNLGINCGIGDYKCVGYDRYDCIYSGYGTNYSSTASEQCDKVYCYAQCKAGQEGTGEGGEGYCQIPDGNWVMFKKCVNCTWSGTGTVCAPTCNPATFTPDTVVCYDASTGGSVSKPINKCSGGGYIVSLPDPCDDCSVNVVRTCLNNYDGESIVEEVVLARCIEGHLIATGNKCDDIYYDPCADIVCKDICGKDAGPEYNYYDLYAQKCISLTATISKCIPDYIKTPNAVGCGYLGNECVAGWEEWITCPDGNDIRTKYCYYDSTTKRYIIKKTGNTCVDLCAGRVCNDKCYDDGNLWREICDPETGNCVPLSIKTYNAPECMGVSCSPDGIIRNVKYCPDGKIKSVEKCENGVWKRYVYDCLGDDGGGLVFPPELILPITVAGIAGVGILGVYFLMKRRKTSASIPLTEVK